MRPDELKKGLMKALLEVVASLLAIPILVAGLLPMPLSVAISVATIAIWPSNKPGFGFLSIVNGIYWLWAVKNRLLGPIWIDGGIVSFLPGLIVGVGAVASAELAAWPWWSACGIASCLLPAMHFGFAALEFSKLTFQQLADNNSKPLLWAKVFLPFCWCMAAVWLGSAIYGGAMSGIGWFHAAMGAGPIALVLILSAKALGDTINARMVCTNKPPAVTLH